MRVQPGQAPGAAVAQPSLAGEDHKLGLPAELPAQRPPGPLVPDHDAPPRPARRLHSVRHCGKLPPVRKHEQWRSVPGHAPALGKPQRSPHDERPLIPVVPEHRRICLHCPVVLILDRGIGLACGKHEPAARIRRIGNHGIHAKRGKGLQNGQRIPLVQGQRGVFKKGLHESS